MNETDIMHMIMLALSGQGYKVFRTNVGKVKLADGRWFDTGLPKGHADLYGFRPDGQIFYIEVKAPGGKVRPKQKQFLCSMKQSGALCGVAYSVDDALEIAGGVE